ICRIESPTEKIEEILVHFSFITLAIIYMFSSNYAGQKITDYNNHVFSTIYNIPWYLASLNIQKLILFLLQRGSKIFILSIGGLITGSLRNFAS
ncbi:hypothetical protein HN011_005782, partial [Eciton burchellii]